MPKSRTFAASKGQISNKNKIRKNMIVLVFFSVVLLFSLTLNAVYKIMEYKSDRKTVWEDGDSVCIKEEHDQYNISFMHRIA